MKAKPYNYMQLIPAIFVAGLLTACSAILPEGTSQIKSRDAEGQYPQIGLTPAKPAPELSPAERDRLFKELAAARDANAKAAATPVTQPVR